MSGHSKWHTIAKPADHERRARIREWMYAEIALVALELASGLETADDLIIDSADGGRIVVIEGADVDYPPPGWPIDL